MIEKLGSFTQFFCKGYDPTMATMNKLWDKTEEIIDVLNSKPECEEKVVCPNCCSEPCECIPEENPKEVENPKNEGITHHDPVAEKEARKDSLKSVIRPLVATRFMKSTSDYTDELDSAIRKYLLEKVDKCLSWHNERNNKLCVYLDDVKELLK